MKLILVIGILCVYRTHGFNPYKRVVSSGAGYRLGDSGDPLILTSYIDANDIDGGRRAASVPTFTSNPIQSYSGYFTVNKTLNSNLFFWFFLAEEDSENAPVVVWLQGGPGASSMFGIFTEHGPYHLDSDGNIGLRDTYWTSLLNVIYIDNPVGTGFSFTDSEEGYAKDEVRVGNELHEAITQFFKIFPEYKKNDFFVSGESYGGKYVPALAYTIHEKNKETIDRINLKGLAIGNGLCDPVNMLSYGKHLYQIGLIDEENKNIFVKTENQIIELINKEQYNEAFEMFDRLVLGDMNPGSLFYNITGFSFYFNYLHTRDDSTDGDLGVFFQNSTVRKSIHVGDRPFNDGHIVEQHLSGDVMKSIKPWFEELIENYRVLIYNGQLDIIVAYPLTTSFLETVNWSGASQYKTAKRKKWFVSNELAGYTKTINGFTEVLVRNAGHMVPVDQPIWAMELALKFFNNIPISS